MTALVESSDANSIGKHDTNSTRQMTESVHSLDAELKTACLYMLGTSGEAGGAHNLGAQGVTLIQPVFTGAGITADTQDAQGDALI